MNWVKLGISIAALVAVFLSGWTVNGWRYQAKADAQHRAQLAAQTQADQEAAKANAETTQREREALSKIQSLQDSNAQLLQEIDHAQTLIQTPAPLASTHPGPAIAACPRLGPDFLRLYNAASRDSAATPNQASPVPAASTNGPPAPAGQPPRF